jgi:uncharacterized membrane protein YfcA
MNALAGGGTFATLPALITLGLPANVANATSNVALLPGAAASNIVTNWVLLVDCPSASSQESPSPAGSRGVSSSF